MTTRTDGGIFTSSNVWAENGQKDEPTFTETDGWDISYSQAGGDVVERTLMNRNFNKSSACLFDINRFGANLIWTSSVLLTYEIGAQVVGSDGINYRSKTQNTGVDPVSDDGTNWEYVTPVISGDTNNITVSKDSRNNVSVTLNSNISDKANKTLDNVTVGDFLGKFENSDRIIWSFSGTKAKATYNSPNNIIISDTNYTLTESDIGLNIYWVATANSSGDFTLTLPLASAIANNWFVDISINNQGNTSDGKLKIVPNGTDELIRNNIQSNSSVNFIKGTKNTKIRIFKLPNTNVFEISGLSEAYYEVNDEQTPITGGVLKRRGYSVIGGTLNQWVMLQSDINNFPMGTRAHVVEVPLLLAYDNSNYNINITLRDNSAISQSATFNSQPVAYGFNMDNQNVRIGSYYDTSKITMYLSCIGKSMDFRG
jgi:hypothetical protein